MTSRSVFDIDSIDSWHTDSVALLGDAAHAMLHHQGQGANSAILDAGGLADALLQGGSVKDALAIYQATRKPVTDELQRVSRQGWHADAVDSRLPGQTSQSAEAKPMPIHPRSPKSSAPCRHPTVRRWTRQAMRAGEAAQVAPLEDRLPLHAVEDLTAATPSGDVPVRIYTPVEADAYGLLVYFHGGAFFLGSLDTHDHVARSLAKETGHKVISVGYRLAPEAAFPAGLDDCYGVVRWAAEQRRIPELGREEPRHRRRQLGRQLRRRRRRARPTTTGSAGITHQVLFYPSLDLDFDVDRYASLRENAEGYGLETAGLLPFNSFYLESGADPADPLVSPIKREDLAGLPPALVITAEHDPLRDEGELYGQRLTDAGVDTTVSRYAGANHGFVQNFSWIPEFHRAFRETGDFLNGSAAQ